MIAELGSIVIIVAMLILALMALSHGTTGLTPFGLWDAFLSATLCAEMSGEWTR